MDIVNILYLINEYAEANGLSTSYVSAKCVGDSNLHKRLKAGGDMTTRRATAVVQWFSDNWPADLFWPTHIPRPVPAPDSPAAQARAANKPANELNADGEIANLADWCRRNAYEVYDARRVIQRYGVGGKYEGRYPRRGSVTQFVLEQLIKTGDRRFRTYHHYDRIAGAASPTANADFFQPRGVTP